MNNLRVAWLLPVCWYYWQPALAEFAKHFSQTKVYTGLFPGYVQGLENCLNVEVVGEFKPLANQRKKSYGSGFTYLSPLIAIHLIKFKPNIILSSSFGIWTIIALLLKPWQQWQVIIAYEGSSPGVDYLNSPLRLLIRKAMVRAADGFITNSQRGKNYLIDILKASSDRVFNHPYEIPYFELLKDKADDTNITFERYQRPIFLFAGRIIQRKGIDTLLKACLKLNQLEKTNYTVLIVGEGDLRSTLETFCVDNQLNNNIFWIGRVKYEEIDAYFKNADVFVFPTWEETWGVVLLEAMLFGKAVISSTGAGSSELITEDVNGYLFNPNRPEELVKLMSKFIDNPELINFMGKQSISTMNFYTPQVGGKFLVDAVNSISTLD